MLQKQSNFFKQGRGQEQTATVSTGEAPSPVGSHVPQGAPAPPGVQDLFNERLGHFSTALRVIPPGTCFPEGQINIEVVLS